MNKIAFCLYNAEKALYAPSYDLGMPRLVAGGWLIADNVISHRQVLQPFVEQVLTDPRVDTAVLPLDRGLLRGGKGEVALAATL